MNEAGDCDEANRDSLSATAQPALCRWTPALTVPCAARFYHILNANCIWIWATSEKPPQGTLVLFYVRVSTSASAGRALQKLPFDWYIWMGILYIFHGFCSGETHLRIEMHDCRWDQPVAKGLCGESLWITTIFPSNSLNETWEVRWVGGCRRKWEFHTLKSDSFC